MQSKVIILFGSPGSGKGQQADLLADMRGLIHIDTGKLLRAILKDPEALKDPKTQKEKELNDAGILNTPAWVVEVLKKKIEAVAKLGYGIVFSGSPRTLYEAQEIFPFLETLFGKEYIKIFYLNVPLEVAEERNRSRFVCGVCRRPLLAAYYPSKNPESCPVCAGPLERRVDDDPEKFKTRSREYIERTKPAIDYAREHGFPIHEIDGTEAPFKVFQAIVKDLS